MGVFFESEMDKAQRKGMGSAFYLLNCWPLTQTAPVRYIDVSMTSFQRHVADGIAASCDNVRNKYQHRPAQLDARCKGSFAV